MRYLILLEYPCYFFVSLSVTISNNLKPEALANRGRMPPGNFAFKNDQAINVKISVLSS